MRRYGRMKFDDFKIFVDDPEPRYRPFNPPWKHDDSHESDCKPEYRCIKPKSYHSEKSHNLLCGNGLTLIFESREYIEIAYLEFDSSDLQSPTIKVDFSTMVDLIAMVKGRVINTISTSIRFLLVRENINGQRIKLGEWNYSQTYREVNISPESFSLDRSESFCFSFCDNIVCPGCYLYKVIAEPSTRGSIVRFGVNSSSLNALLQCNTY